ncbi:NADH dehydrogenase [ubiquinone] 1 beta subcomplex subunit 11 mitochondrial [Biomphalaria pfeifferi]|uniref:NADH dehydrogenase [ubiquinone] 1 beta subcomplex subunit 11 mitochondrial n=1 Tax=Biomphalaria pfeifferi TaxID=112525 RepID=A0AAD8FN16_BIOPF|nr:NADH dehydrogenase [ubiquinone] 1 beta subcomplex subunit 11 mitochondrial [Biomphalaria pfeifferi]
MSIISPSYIAEAKMKNREEYYVSDMATLLRLVGRQGRALQTLVNNKSLIFPLLKHKASISTSEKKKDVGAVVQPMEKSEELKKLTEKFKDPTDTEENYVSYGYEPGNRDKD